MKRDLRLPLIVVCVASAFRVLCHHLRSYPFTPEQTSLIPQCNSFLQCKIVLDLISSLCYRLSSFSSKGASCFAFLFRNGLFPRFVRRAAFDQSDRGHIPGKARTTITTFPISGGNLRQEVEIHDEGAQVSGISGFAADCAAYAYNADTFDSVTTSIIGLTPQPPYPVTRRRAGLFRASAV